MTSNTNGSNVASVGYWPSGILPRIVEILGGTIKSLKGIISGDVTASAVDYAPKGGSDKVADVVMDEISRRLIVTYEKPNPGNIAYQPEAPDDHSKLWVQTDVQTGIPVGGIQRWSETSGKWVPADPAASAYTPPLQRSGFLAVTAGNSTNVFSFENIKTTDYRVTLTPTTYLGGAWNAAPANFPDGYAVVVTNKTSNELTIAVFDAPTGGLAYEIDVQARS